MNSKIKLERYYSPSRMSRAIFLMEQFYLLSKDRELEDTDRLCARKLFEHFKRLAICILTKEMPENLYNEDSIDDALIIDTEFMKNMYRQYQNT